MMVPEYEAESPLQREQQQNNNKNHPFSSQGRQNSIYSLTLDEFQHTLWESGKNFGSMNMDEFLNSIWSAEENQVLNNSNLSLTELCAGKGEIKKQPTSLHRQGSLTLPAPLYRKTVDEVWTEIHKGQQSQQQQNINNNGGNATNISAQNAKSTTRQPTFGEMTLEDFLIKAGVVREQCELNMQAQNPPLQQYDMYHSNNSTMGPSFVMGIANSAAGGGGVIRESSGYVGNGTKNIGYSMVVPTPGVCFGGRVMNGSGFAMSTVSPVSPEALGTGESSGGQFGMDMRGSKRVLDSPVEKVVERRQRRMIKNRESAARSRARKQAYTIELEAELNQLKEENSQLKLALADLERRNHQYVEEMNGRVQPNAQKHRKKLGSLRRTKTCSL